MAAQFKLYEVSPVVDTTDWEDDGTCQAFPSLADAEADVAVFEAKGSFDGVEGKRLIWSLYASMDGQELEWIADGLTEAAVFELLGRLTGLDGVPGVRFYPL